VNVGTVIVIGHAFVNREKMVVGKTLFLGDVGDNVLAESVNTHVQLKTEYLLHFLTDEGVIHIEVGLLYGEKVQIIFAALFVPCPCLALKV